MKGKVDGKNRMMMMIIMTVEKMEGERGKEERMEIKP